MSDNLTADLKRRMAGALDALAKEFAGLRTGRANTALLEPVMVNAYGSQMPLTQLGTVTTPDARMLAVQVWDKSMVAPVEKAIREAGLGLNPVSDGQLVRVPLPELSEERRIEMTKIAKKYAENARVSVRNIRRDGMEALKKMEKDGEMSEDDYHKRHDDVQHITDDYIKKIDDALESKEKDILQV